MEIETFYFHWNFIISKKNAYLSQSIFFCKLFPFPRQLHHFLDAVAVFHRVILNLEPGFVYNWELTSSNFFRLFVENKLSLCLKFCFKFIYTWTREKQRLPHLCMKRLFLRLWMNCRWENCVCRRGNLALWALQSCGCCGSSLSF